MTPIFRITTNSIFFAIGMREKFNVWYSQYASTIKDKGYSRLTEPIWKSHLHDGDMVCFMNGDNTDIVTDQNGFSISLYVNALKSKGICGTIMYPINRLYLEHDSDKYHRRSMLEEIECVKQILDKAWIAHEKQVFDGNGKAVKIFILSPVEESVLLEWYLKEEEILFELEIWPIKEKYDKKKQENTTYEQRLLSSEEGPRSSRSRFTWGEGYDEWQSWTVTETWEIKTYYRGLLLETKTVERTHEEDNR